MNDFLVLNHVRYQKKHHKEEVKELERQILELQAEISTLKALQK